MVHLGPANSALLQSLGIEHLAGDSVVHLGTANSALLQSLGIILPMPTEHAQSSGSAYRRRAAGRSDSEVVAGEVLQVLADAMSAGTFSRTTPAPECLAAWRP